MSNATTISGPEVKEIALDHLPRFPGIYRLANNVTGEFYIGASTNIWKRAKRHDVALRTGIHENHKLDASYQKSGPDAFEFSVLEPCIPDDLNAREKHWIDALKPQLNCKPGPRHLKARKACPNTGKHLIRVQHQSRAKLELVAKHSGWKFGVLIDRLLDGYMQEHGLKLPE